MDKENPRLLVGSGILSLCTPGELGARGLAGFNSSLTPLILHSLIISRPRGVLHVAPAEGSQW